MPTTRTTRSYSASHQLGGSSVAVSSLIQGTQSRKLWNSSAVSRQIDKISVTGTVRNPGNKTVNGSVKVTIDGTTIGGQSVSLPPGSQRSFTIARTTALNVAANATINIVFSSVTPSSWGANATLSVQFPCITAGDLITLSGNSMAVLGVLGTTIGANHSPLVEAHGTTFQGIRVSTGPGQGVMIRADALGDVYNSIQSNFGPY